MKHILNIYTTLPFNISVSKFYQNIDEITNENFGVFDAKFEQIRMALFSIIFLKITIPTLACGL